MAIEALIGWPCRKQGHIPPGSFVSVTERSNSIDRIGDWMLLEACREAARWNGARLSVNVSARPLELGSLLIRLEAALDQSGLAPDRLELELTAASLAGSSTDASLALSAIRDLGVGLALDDFGTCFAHLSMLERLPLTAIRLDRSLVRGLPMSRKDAAVVRAVVEAGRAMRLTTMAGGIETEAQRAFLSGIGCDAGQGDLFSHPLPPGQLRPLLGVARS